MITIATQQGKRVEIVLESELCSPVEMGTQVRAYCHIHGSDHQRSLSITKATGWGHCFNASCAATVLVVEWNRPAAKRLLHLYYRGLTAAVLPSYHSPHAPDAPLQGMEARHHHSFIQPLLLPPPRAIPPWQQEERDVLCILDEQLRHSLVVSPRARLYLHERGIPLEVAQAARVGYLPATLLNEPQVRKQRRVLQRWVDRMIFPLCSPDGQGYIGRSLWRWQPGMKEATHRALLERSASPKRWIKTNPAGWFGPDGGGAETMLLVEGAFDRLTLLAVGLPPTAIVALVGTALPLDWLPAGVKTVVLALDGDMGGREASHRLSEHLLQTGMHVQVCSLPQDTWGKDWNERWQRLGQRGIAPVFKAVGDSLK